MMKHVPTTQARRRRTGAVAVAFAVALGLTGAAAASANGSHQQKADIMGQGGDGITADNGATLSRTDHSFSVSWKLQTPEPGSYSYPTADMIPPGAPPHPEVVAGSPEVFTLWAFVFDFAENCTVPCDFDDIGDTPARGSIYQLDGVVADGNTIRMGGKVRLGQQAVVGLGLSNPEGAEIHVAMAPHGSVADGQLARQLNGAIGGPPQWFAAIFLPG